MDANATKYGIEIHYGFMIAEWVEQIRNCRVTKNASEALKFDTKKMAQKFINDHDGEGLNKKTAKIFEIK